MVQGGRGLGAARLQWSECERQLYAGAISDPSSYEQAVVAVRTMTDRMRTITSLEQLEAVWPNAANMPELAVPPDAQSLPKLALLGAAFALRERELKEQCARERKLKRIDDARRSGRDWVMLDEAGEPRPELFAPYRSIEMHLPTGLALMSTIQPDPMSGAGVFAVAVVQLDPNTGELMDAEPGVEDGKEFARQEEFEARRIALRNQVSGLAG